MSRCRLLCHQFQICRAVCRFFHPNGAAVCHGLLHDSGTPKGLDQPGFDRIARVVLLREPKTIDDVHSSLSDRMNPPVGKTSQSGAVDIGPDAVALTRVNFAWARH